MKLLGRALSWELLASAFSEDNSEDFVLLANELLTLSNSRKFESDADKRGLQLLEQNHIDINGMPRLFELMQEIAPNDDSIPIYLKTHPGINDRLRSMRSQAEKSKNNFKENNKLQKIFNDLTHMKEHEADEMSNDGISY